MIVIAEINYRGNVHEMINSCMVEMVRMMWPGEEICLVGERSMVDNLRALSSVDNIEVHDLHEGRKDGSRLGSLYRVLRFARRGKASRVVLLSLLPVGGVCLRLLRPLFPSTKVMAVLHGELEHLRRKRDEADHKLGVMMRFALRACSRRTRFIVLGEPVRRNLLKHMPRLSPHKVVAIDHPYHYPEFAAGQKDAPAGFVQFGVGSISKGTQNIFPVARRVRQSVPGAKFYIAGGIYPELGAFLDSDNVVYPAPGSNLSRAQIDQIAAKCSYSLFFYTNEHYRLCASGAFFDAVRYGLPIVGLRNDFFEYYFEKYGRPGYLFDSTEELEGKLRELAAAIPHDEYAAQVESLENLRNELQINAIASRFKEQLNGF